MPLILPPAHPSGSFRFRHRSNLSPAIRPMRQARARRRSAARARRSGARRRPRPRGLQSHPERRDQSARGALGATNKPYAGPGDFVEVGLEPGHCDALSLGFGPAGDDHVVSVVFTPPGESGARRLPHGRRLLGLEAEALRAACETTVGRRQRRLRPSVGERPRDRHPERHPAPFVPLSRYRCDLPARGRRPHARRPRDDRRDSGRRAVAVRPRDLDVRRDDRRARLRRRHLRRRRHLSAEPRQDVQPLHGAAASERLREPLLREQPRPLQPDELRAADDDRRRRESASCRSTGRACSRPTAGVPVPRLLRATLRSPLGFNVPDPVFLGSYTPEGAKLPPIFEPTADPTVSDPDVITLFGSVDAPYTILRIARRAGTCSNAPGRACVVATDCPTGGTCPTTCVGSAPPGTVCANDGPVQRWRPLRRALRRLRTARRERRSDSACAHAGRDRRLPVGTARALHDTRQLRRGRQHVRELRLRGTRAGGARELYQGTTDQLAFTVEERVDLADHNGDGDTTDSVITLRDRLTGGSENLGAPAGCGHRRHARGPRGGAHQRAARSTSRRPRSRTTSSPSSNRSPARSTATSTATARRPDRSPASSSSGPARSR